MENMLLPGGATLWINVISEKFEKVKKNEVKNVKGEIIIKHNLCSSNCGLFLTWRDKQSGKQAYMCGKTLLKWNISEIIIYKKEKGGVDLGFSF